MNVLGLFLVAVSPTFDAVIPPKQSRLPQAEALRSMPKADLFDRPVEPRGNLAAIVNNDDYPLDALRNLEQGTVGLILTIDERGRVSDCIVEYSSGSASLDSQTCRLMWLRAQLEPGRDRAGRPVSSAMRARIRWVLPEPESLPIVPWSTRIILTLAKGGAVMSCKVEMSGALHSDDGACGYFSVIPSQFLAPLVASATADVATVYMDSRFLPGEVKDQAVVDPKTRLMNRQVVHVTIDPTGKVSRCSTMESDGLAADHADGCLDIGFWKFKMPTTKAGLPTSLDATIVRELRRRR